MTRLHQYIRRAAAILAALTGLAAALAASATPALASIPLPGGPTGAAEPVIPAVTRTVVVGGMPGWQIALIAVGAALLAAVGAVLADRARTAHRHAMSLSS